MKVNIGLLKNDFSKYLHKVREGEEITVTDRNEPIAKITPLERPVIRADLSAWVKENLPVKIGKKQPPSLDALKDLRDEG
jgi:prevent-host-death family protein